MGKSPIFPAAPRGARSLNARSLGEALDQPQLQSLLNRAGKLAAIQRALRDYLNEPWADSLRVANLRGTTLALHSSNAAALTALRHRQAELVAALNQRLGLSLSKIELKVRPAPSLGTT
jgi:hypothetical protein